MVIFIKVKSMILKERPIVVICKPYRFRDQKSLFVSPQRKEIVQYKHECGKEFCKLAHAKKVINLMIVEVLRSKFVFILTKLNFGIAQVQHPFYCLNEYFLFYLFRTVSTNCRQQVQSLFQEILFINCQLEKNGNVRILTREKKQNKILFRKLAQKSL